MRKTLLALSLVAASAPALATDYSDNIHKNDYKWLQFNLMYAVNEKPQTEAQGDTHHDYLEMEFGGRSGIVDLYGYVDVFNLLSGDQEDNDKASDNADKTFMKLNPRFSLDGMTGHDLSFGPVQELYIATLMEWDGGNRDEGGTNTQKVGLGSDIMVPWFGKMGLNLYATYDSNMNDWNGGQISTNWFKPFYTFSNGSYIAYQGYLDFQFGMKEDESDRTDHGGVMFNGIYWHNDQFAVGYGLKGYYNAYGLKDGSQTTFQAGEWESTGLTHFFDVTYKF
ncbi:MAG: outer membrane protein OmpK [Vibrio sp.]